MTSSWDREDLAQSGFNIFTVAVEVSQIQDIWALSAHIKITQRYKLQPGASFSVVIPSECEWQIGNIWNFPQHLCTLHNAASQQNIPKIGDKYVIMKD